MLWRRDVFDVADAWRAGVRSSKELTTAVLMWGLGSTGYGPYRAATILRGDPEDARLDIGLEPLRADKLSEDDLLSAYVSFSRRQAAYVRGLGPAFFTKLIYFAGYRRGAGGVQPLILDKLVAQQLPEDAGPARRRTWGWRSAEWLKYLQWAAEQSRSPGYDDEPERVEMELYGTARRRKATERR